MNDAGFAIYPNPTQNNFTLAFAGQSFDITVFDMAGRKIFERLNVIDQTSINCAAFSAGIYTVYARNANQIFTRRLVVSR